MNLEELKKNYPNIDLAELNELFPRIAMTDYPELSEYSWEACHHGSLGGGALFLASEMARKMDLEAGMRVLDLGCGHGASSIFLARHYGVTVVAADNGVSPSANWQGFQGEGLNDKVIPVKMDARNIVFPERYFDAVFSMNAYLYFGTDDLYLSYLTRFIRNSGRICIAGPCYAEELRPDTPKELLEGESFAYHSPSWWCNHFAKTDLVRVLHCQDHPKGREFWLDMIRWIIEDTQNRGEAYPDFLWHDMVMLLSDQERFVTYFLLLAEKKSS
ncbi:MAG: methyltransferase domain-containing protein [Anaerolineales bacterium]|nr:methyltransferase domain-containing protein [Anaerolineales bacterium]